MSIGHQKIGSGRAAYAGFADDVEWTIGWQGFMLCIQNFRVPGHEQGILDNAVFGLVGFPDIDYREEVSIRDPFVKGTDLDRYH